MKALTLIHSATIVVILGAIGLGIALPLYLALSRSDYSNPAYNTQTYDQKVLT